MTRQILIDNIVRQTTILIAQLATSGGVRSPLAQIADRVFLDLAHELDSQGISRTVSADMFGMALRSYRRRIRQLSESSTERGRSLWEAVLDFLSRGSLVTREEVLRRFHRDEEALVKGVVNDLCESGLVFKLGTGKGAPAGNGAPSESHPPSCEGTTLTFCNAGRLEHVDCVSLGFTGCDVEEAYHYGCIPPLQVPVEI